ncbi:MAG: hypothetical protein AAF541_00230 [Pseudomonadota bacterium]
MSKETPVTIDPARPVRLDPVCIPKPWGQEIWYTGIEKRGVSGVLIEESRLPIDEYLACNPGGLSNHAPLLLLKILDPKPTQVVGDLYFEVHEEKQEVYVVTSVDRQAWPGGKGAIRFGMNQSVRSKYTDDDAFRQAYLEAVQDYEGIRRKIDDGPLSPGDEAIELELRATMESFTSMRPLSVGDVVKVPTWTPHALQHGVRVVEFQTATYERFIISFAQKVLTQNHWDSQTAVAKMSLDAPEPPSFQNVGPGIERIVEFSDFNVWRAQACESVDLPKHVPYAVCMSLADGVTIADLTLQAEEACFIPYQAIQQGITIHNQRRTVLISAPNL